MQVDVIVVSLFLKEQIRGKVAPPLDFSRSRSQLQRGGGAKHDVSGP